MANEPQPMGPAEQNELLLELTLLLTHELPAGWETATIAHRALGSHSETYGQVQLRGRRLPSPFRPPEHAAELFQRLRAGMYRPDTGTWFTATFRLTYPSSYDIRYDARTEPAWVTPPPASARDEELRTFPRESRHLPEWLGGTAGVAEMPIAKPYEGSQPDGTPIVGDRPPVPAEEVDALARYLEKAPILLAARSFAEDMMDPERTRRVPMTYHTDGTWIWPGAVAYYLRAHGVPPQPELVAHVRGNGFELPGIPDDVVSDALKYLYSSFERGNDE